MNPTAHHAVRFARQFFTTETAWAKACGVNRSTSATWREAEVGEMKYNLSSTDPMDLIGNLLLGVYQQGLQDGARSADVGDEGVDPEEKYWGDDDTLNAKKNVPFEPVSLEDAAALFDVDRSAWQAVDFETSFHDVPMKRKVVGEDGRSIEVDDSKRCYRVWVKWRRSVMRQSIEAFVKQVLKSEGVDLKPVEQNERRQQESGSPHIFTPSDGQILTVAAQPDLHLGNIINPETGGGTWDLKTGADQFREAYDQGVRQAISQGSRGIIITLGSDAHHANVSSGTSTNGTQYTCIEDPVLVTRTMADCYLWAVERALKDGFKVYLIPVPGNHDEDPTEAQAQALYSRYHDWDDVWIDRSLQPVKFFRHGVNLLAFHHGKSPRSQRTLSPDQLYAYVSEGAGHAWPETVVRVVFVGHFHGKGATRVGAYDTYQGLTYRILPTLCPPDGWHLRSGYLGALRSSEVWHYHSTHGQVGMQNFIPESTLSADTPIIPSSMAA